MFSLRLSNVSFSFPKNSSVASRPGFCLTIPSFAPGLCTAVLGETGSGKTTLGKLAAGILRPDFGQVLYDGQDIKDWPLGKIGRQVGYLFQDPSRQIFAPYPLEEIAFPLTLRGMSKADAENKARELLAEFELDGVMGSTTYKLSRGEKQRLAIAAVMACEPRFLVLDEPTTGLDKERRKLLSKTLQRLLATKVGLLIMGHDQAFVEELGAAKKFLKGGRLLDS